VYAGIQPWRLAGSSTPAFSAPSFDDLSRDMFGAVIVAGILLGFGLLGLSGRKPAAVLAVWAAVPLAASVLLAARVTFDPVQFALLAMPAWICLSALMLARMPVARGVFAVAVLAAVALPAQLDIRRPDGHGQASHQVADLLYTQGKPGDAIIYGPSSGDGPAGRDIVDRYLSAAHRPKDILALAAPRSSTTRQVPECLDVDACLVQTERIWLLRVGSYDSPLTGLEAGKDGALRVRYAVTQTWTLAGVSLTLYTLLPVK
jgi:mannosyltransferase